MDVGALLGRYKHLRTERPPLLWEAQVAEERLLPLLEALLVAAQSPGTSSRALTLSASNIVVPPESVDPRDEDSAVPVGEYVGITLHGPGTWTHDWTWLPGRTVPVALPEAWRDRLPASGACFAYGRDLAGESSVTLFLPRAQAPG